MTFASPEDKFGIKLEARDGRTLEQNFSMIAGIIYLLGGIIGFFYTGFTSNLTQSPGTAVFGLFMVNPFHNIVHIAVGGLWLLGAFALTAAGNEGLNIAIGGFYVLAALLGFLGYLSFISVGAGNAPDNYLHLVTGLLALVFGSGLLSAMGRR